MEPSRLRSEADSSPVVPRTPPRAPTSPPHHGPDESPPGRLGGWRDRSTSQRAVRRRRASPWRGPTSWTPSGRPFAPCMSGTVMRGHAGEGPQRAEGRIAGRVESGGRRAGRGRGQDGVVALLEQLGEARRTARGMRRQRALVVEGARPRGRARAAPAATSDSRSRPSAHSRSRFTAISASMMSAMPLERLRGRPRPARPPPRGRRARSASSAKASRASSVDRVPARRLDEGEHRRQRRLLGRDLAVRDAGAGPRVGIALVVAGELLGEQREVVDRCARRARRGRACARAGTCRGAGSARGSA